MKIVPMQPDHYDALVALWNSFPGNTMTGADSRDGFIRFVQRNRAFCFTAVAGEEIVGSVMAGEDTRRGYIYHLAVSAEYQHSGIGRALMRETEEALRKSGIEKIHLLVYPDNPAVDFYRRIGWHLRDDVWIMSKIL